MIFYENSNTTIFNKLQLNKVIGMNKKQVTDYFGQESDDTNNNVWMYSVTNLTSEINSKKYLYLFFQNNILMRVKFSRLKKSILYEMIGN